MPNILFRRGSSKGTAGFAYPYIKFVECRKYKFRSALLMDRIILAHIILSSGNEGATNTKAINDRAVYYLHHCFTLPGSFKRPAVL